MNWLTQPNINNTKVYFINLRNSMLDEKYDAQFRKANLDVTGDDIGILENLYPVRTPSTTTREIMTPGDAAVVSYRKHLKNWEAKGWRIDRKAMVDVHGDVAFSIPSPQRRDSGNWVLDPVPLVTPSA